MAPTTPAMTAQEALAAMDQPEWGTPEDVEAVRAALSDAERRARDWKASYELLQKAAGAEIERANVAESRLSAVEARCGLMREFARWAIAEGVWEGGSLDGGQIQDKAVELGLLNATKYDPAIHGDNASDAEPGDEWFVYSSILAYPGGKSDQGEKEKP